MVINKEASGRISLSPGFAWAVLSALVAGGIAGGLLIGGMSSTLESVGKGFANHVVDHRSNEGFYRGVESRLSTLERENGTEGAKLAGMQEDIRDIKKEQQQILALLRQIQMGRPGP